MEGGTRLGEAEVVLTIDANDLVIEYLSGGRSVKRSYTLEDGYKRRSMRIDGYEEQFALSFMDADRMCLCLSEDENRKEAVPLISAVTFYRTNQ
jgi:hypothetical protein